MAKHSKKRTSLLIFGGSFDPIHCGHLEVAINVQNFFHFDHFIFLPNHVSPLKNECRASVFHRIQMMKIALPKAFEIDLREINRPPPSYMVDTLRSYRREVNQNDSITILMGEDVFANFTRWHQWNEILTLANILLIHREHENFALSSTLKDLLSQHEIQLLGSAYKPREVGSTEHAKKALLKTPHGAILKYDAGHFSLSSTDLRRLLSENKAPKSAFPQGVFEYIQSNNLYLVTPHVIPTKEGSP